MAEDDARLRRIKFRAWHRGFREADLILGPFADRHAGELSSAQLDAFERLLEAPDPTLYAWITETEAVPEEHAGEVLELIQSFRRFAHAAIDPTRRGA
ncbi:MAG TPA: succinate dehydrogenase assembly factor 2 [Caulobacteraceae bacterium]